MGFLKAKTAKIASIKMGYIIIEMSSLGNLTEHSPSPNELELC